MNTPNKITIFRFVLALVVIVLLFPYQHYGIDIYKIPFGITNPLLGSYNGLEAWQVPTFGFTVLDLLACILFVTASITDTIDGQIARKRNLITNFGKFMDPLADKFLVNGTLIMLCFRGFSGTLIPNTDMFLTNGIFMPTIIVVLMSGRDLIVDGIKMLASSQGTVVAANNWGKAKTIAQMIVIPFYILNGFPFYYLFGKYTNILMICSITLVLILSLISGGIYLYQGKDCLKDKK